MKRPLSLLLGISLTFGAAAPPARGDARRLPSADKPVSPILLPMLDARRPAKPSMIDFQQSSLRDAVRLTTPRGYRLKMRFLDPRVAVVQALALTADEQLRQRLVEAARWSATPTARAEGLLGIAAERNPAHLKYFKEAILDQDLNIQFAAIEALQLWARPEAAAYLADAAQRAWSPIIQVYAAQALLRMGDARGRQKLLDGLQAPGWLTRAMSARYLGDLGKAGDADLLLSRIGPERDNKFVLAEVCVAALKLLAKKQPPPPPPPAPSRPRPTPAPRNPFELEPLVVTAPRLAANLVDVRIDNDLVRLLEDLANEPPPQEQLLNSSEEELNRLSTPTGFALKIRYSDLSVLLTEGLAGTQNYTLVSRLETIARSNPSARVRGSALVALGFQPRRKELSIFQEALRDPNVITRFAAVEALSAMDDEGARAVIAGAAQSDPSMAVQAFAAQRLCAAGDPYGRQLLYRFMDDRDWTLRAMAVYGLGEWGEAEDYYTILNRVNGESHDAVRAEAALALLKLSKRFP